MDFSVLVALIAVMVMAVVGFVVGRRGKGNQQDNSGLVDSLQSQISELNVKIKAREETVATQSEQIRSLTSERDVQKAHADNYQSLMVSQKEDYEKQLCTQGEENRKRHDELRATSGRGRMS